MYLERNYTNMFEIYCYIVQNFCSRSLIYEFHMLKY